jgi:FkbM family methyltransferase
VKSGWTVIDVGANIGYYSLLIGRWVGPKGLVHAFEPQPAIFKQLCRHLILNKTNWIKPHQQALGDTIEQRFMTSIPEWNYGMQRIATEKDIGVNQVEITTLDEFVKYEQLNRIDLIKVDIEGYEFKFLKGAEHSLNKFKPLLFIELNPDALIAQGSNMDQLLKFLVQSGYVLYQFNRTNLIPLKNVPDSGKFLNIVARPADMQGKEVSLL